MNGPLVVRDLKQTCTGCPSQWEARTVDDDRPVYIRYRYGYLSVDVGPPGGSVFDAIDAGMKDGEYMGAQIGQEWDGFISWPQVQEAAGIEVLT